MKTSQSARKVGVGALMLIEKLDISKPKREEQQKLDKGTKKESLF